MLPHGSQLTAVTVTGPDGKQWLPAFTDAGALRAFKPGTHRELFVSRDAELAHDENVGGGHPAAERPRRQPALHRAAERARLGPSLRPKTTSLAMAT
jgi:hypothetical protein